MRENIPALMVCGITVPEMDLVSPALIEVQFLLVMFLWSDCKYCFPMMHWLVILQC